MNTLTNVATQKRGTRKKEFYIACCAIGNKKAVWTKVFGYDAKIKCLDGINFFAHQEHKNCWVVSEKNSGLLICNGRSRKAALQNAEILLQRMIAEQGEETVKKMFRESHKKVVKRVGSENPLLVKQG